VGSIHSGQRPFQQDVFQAGITLEQIEGLEDVADRSRAQPVAGMLAKRGHVRPSELDRPGIRSEDYRRSSEGTLVLPEPFSPRRASLLAGGERKPGHVTMIFRPPSGVTEGFAQARNL